MEIAFSGSKIVLKRGDITEEYCDAIVNAANSSLMGGGGVDGAIHRKGGLEIDNECIKIRREKYPDGLPPGEAVITKGGKLRARYVIHTVGPVWRDGKHGEKDILKRCYLNSLKLALENGLECIAFPAISTGAYGYPVDKAADVTFSAIKEFIQNNPEKIKEIRLVLFTDEIYKIFREKAREFFKE